MTSAPTIAAMAAALPHHQGGIATVYIVIVPLIVMVVLFIYGMYKTSI